MRTPVTRVTLRSLMRELARSLPRSQSGRVYFVGGGTAVWVGWRSSTLDVDLHGEPEKLFDDIQEIKERLGVNIEFVQPEHFVPALEGTEERHVFIEKVNAVSFYHHDPYAQVFSKIVRGFARDLEDAESFVSSGLVDPLRLGELVHLIPRQAYSRYPAISQEAVLAAVDSFLGKSGG